MDQKIIDKIKKLDVADLKVAIYFESNRLANQIKDYEVPDAKWEIKDADVKIKVKQESLVAWSEKMNLGIGDVEYLLTGTIFYKQLLKYCGCMLHSSAVVLDGVAYLFSADSGTGKSTHTQLWLKHFKDRVFIINDDKPAIRKVGNDWFVYGTPWSGKTDWNVNTRAKLGAVVFLERSQKNWIKAIDMKEAFPLFYKQTVRKTCQENVDLALTIIDKLLMEIPVYRMGCNISDEAVIMAYNEIRKDI